jgi:hypothetical protein
MRSTPLTQSEMYAKVRAKVAEKKPEMLSVIAYTYLYIYIYI